MKKTLLIFAIAAGFAACKAKDTTTLDSSKNLILLTDSSGVKAGSYLTDTGVTATAANRNAAAPVNTVATHTHNSTATRAPVHTRTNHTSSSSNRTSSNNSTSSTNTTSAPARRTGISKAAKGAIIGGVGGAVIGGVIGKGAKGAIIGGAVGAGGGYIIGRQKDRRDGRIN